MIQLHQVREVREGISNVRLMCATTMLVAKTVTAGLITGSPVTVSAVGFWRFLPFRYNCSIILQVGCRLFYPLGYSGAELTIHEGFIISTLETY